MEATTSPIVTRIAKTLALAKDRAGTPEGETAARIAKNMMDQHAITMADLDIVTREKEDPLTKNDADLGARSMWRRSVMFSVAEHCTLKATYTQGVTRMTLYGHAHDIEVAKYLYDVIVRQVEVAAKANAQTLPTWLDSGMKRSAYNDFACSAASGVRAKLREIRAAEAPKAESSSGTAMVLVARADRVAAYYDSVKGRVGSGGSMSGSFNRAGYDAGRGVSLTAGIAAGSGRPAVS